MSALDFDVVQLRAPEGLNLYLKHQDTGWIFRILPTRDPDQPRLWCLRVEPCAGPSLSAQTAHVDPFYTALGMTREELAVTLAAIREDVVAWLEQKAHPSFRTWLAKMSSQPVPGHFLAPDPPARVARSAARAQAAAAAEEQAR